MFEPKTDEQTALGWASWSVFLTKYSGDKIEMHEFGGECGTYGGEKRCIHSFGGEPWRQETTWKT